LWSAADAWPKHRPFAKFPGTFPYIQCPQQLKPLNVSQALLFATANRQAFSLPRLAAEHATKKNPGSATGEQLTPEFIGFERNPAALVQPRQTG
jgi:hypothetical protein